MAISNEHRAALENLGRDKVRDLLANNMMVHHLILPAWHWLEELDAHEKISAAPDDPAKEFSY